MTKPFVDAQDVTGTLLGFCFFVILPLIPLLFWARKKNEEKEKELVQFSKYARLYWLVLFLISASTATVLTTKYGPGSFLRDPITIATIIIPLCFLLWRPGP